MQQQLSVILHVKLSCPTKAGAETRVGGITLALKMESGTFMKQQICLKEGSDSFAHLPYDFFSLSSSLSLILIPSMLAFSLLHNGEYVSLKSNALR